MTSTTPRQLFLLADHLKLSLLERQRAATLNLDASKQDSHISRSLTQLREGIASLEAEQQAHASTQDSSDDLDRLRRQYDHLAAQFYAPTTKMSPQLKEANVEGLEEDFAAAQTRPKTRVMGGNKSVRFRDNPTQSSYRDEPSQEDKADEANRAALFASQNQSQDDSRYQDDPADQSQLDNQQIHTYHKQVLQDQDAQLDVLGQSIGRQRVLGIQMGDELDEQAEMIGDVESGVDRHMSGLDRARRRLGGVAMGSRGGNWQWILIGVLVVVLVLLLIVFK